jgi:hypothetical protein
MDLKNISNQDLIQRLEKLTRTERKITHVILLHINEVEARRLYAGLGFESLYAYLTKGLLYSESAAYRRLQAARLLKTVPEVAEQIESGALNLSQLTQVQKCLKEEQQKGRKLTPENIQDILNKLENKSNFESEKILATQFNHAVITCETIKPQQDGSVRIEVTFSKEQFEALTQAQSLLSHICPDGKWNEVLTTLAQKFNQSKLGKESHGKNISQGNTEAEVESEVKKDIPPDSETYRPHISVKIKRQLLENAHYECEYVDPVTGRKCTSQHQLQIDHRQPLALGGSHDESNLRVLCRLHNNYEAQCWGLHQPVDGLNIKAKTASH